MFKSLGRYADVGLLVGRVGLGAAYVLHGWPKLAAGAAGWAKLGRAMAVLGIHFYPQVWGLLASLSEFLGGALMVLGFGFRPACLFLAVTMFVAFLSAHAAGQPFGEYSRPLEMLFVFVLLAFVGPGKYSVDRG